MKLNLTPVRFRLACGNTNGDRSIDREFGHDVIILDCTFRSSFLAEFSRHENKKNVSDIEVSPHLPCMCVCVFSEYASQLEHKPHVIHFHVSFTLEPLNWSTKWFRHIYKLVLDNN